MKNPAEFHTLKVKKTVQAMGSTSVIAMLVYGILGFSKSFGSFFWYQCTFIVMMMLTGIFYNFSVRKSVRTLQDNLHEMLEVVNE